MNRTTCISIRVLAILLAIAGFCAAQTPEASPVGLWLTFNEESGDTMSIIRIYPAEDGIEGRIEQLYYRPHLGPRGRCVDCPDSLRDRPVIGLNILHGFRADGREWKDGKILDPASGKMYNATITAAGPDELAIQIRAGIAGILRTTRIWKRQGDAPDAATVEGVWAIYNERFQQISSIVRVTVRDDRLRGEVLETRLMPNEGPDAVCTACEDSLRNQPIVGMRILSRHVFRDGRWRDGRVMDPANGKTYSSALWMESADRLRLRGYLGPFHRTQVWHRFRADD